MEQFKISIRNKDLLLTCGTCGWSWIGLDFTEERYYMDNQYQPTRMPLAKLNEMAAEHNCGSIKPKATA